MPTTKAKAAKRPVNPSKKYIGSSAVRARYNDMSHMWIVRQLENDPTFPRPYKFGRLNLWALDELEEYERSRVRVA